MHPKPRIYPFGIEDLTKRDDWHYLRYGHGAQLAMAGDRRTNCDGHDMGIPGMSDDLLMSIMEPVIGENVAYGMMEINQYVSKKDRQVRNIFAKSPVECWVEADIFFPAIIQGKANVYMEHLLDPAYDICIVGPVHLEKLPRFGLNITEHFMTGKNCYNQKDAALQFLRDRQHNFNTVLFAAAMLSEVLIYQLHDEFMDKGLVDVGAFFDPLCGVRSRGYAKELTDSFLEDSFLNGLSARKDSPA